MYKYSMRKVASKYREIMGGTGSEGGGRRWPELGGGGGVRRQVVGESADSGSIQSILTIY